MMTIKHNTKITKLLTVATTFLISTIVSTSVFAGDEIALGYNFLEFNRASGSQAETNAAGVTTISEFDYARASYAFDFCGSPGFVKVSRTDLFEQGSTSENDSKIVELLGGIHFNYGSTSDVYFAVGSTSTSGKLADRLGIDKDAGFAEIGFRGLAGVSRNWEISQLIRYNEKQGHSAETGVFYHTAAGWSLGISYVQGDDFQSLDALNNLDTYTISDNERTTFTLRLNI